MMKLHTQTALNPLYNGTWYFSYIMDYCLKIHICGRYLKISLTDLTRNNEECELIPICLNEAYLAFRMNSSWGSLRLHLYPHTQSNGILVEIRDFDIYARCQTDYPQPPHRNVIRITCEGDEYPAWLDGVWSTSSSYPHCIYLHRVSPTELRLALWYIDADDETPQYEWINAVYQCGHTGVGMTVRNKHLLHSPMQDRKIIFDSKRQEIQSEFNLICRPCRERRENRPFPDAWRD